MSKNADQNLHVGPLVGADHIQDNFDLVPRSKPNVWLLPLVVVAILLAIGVALW